MNRLPLDQVRDADIRLSLVALERAARRAWRVAQETGTAIVVSRDGVIEYIVPQPGEGVAKVQEPSAPYGDKR